MDASKTVNSAAVKPEEIGQEEDEEMRVLRSSAVTQKTTCVWTGRTCNMPRRRRDRKAASVEWNIPGKYGPHGELFFFLIQKEPATVRLSVPSSRLTSVPPSSLPSPFLFSADVLKKCALVALHPLCGKKEEAEKMDVMLLFWGTNGKWAAQRVQCGRVKAKLGRNTKLRPLLALVNAMWATMRCTSSGCMGLVARSLFSYRIGSWQRWH